jgi:hypothetical protein
MDDALGECLQFVYEKSGEGQATEKKVLVRLFE